MLKPLVSPITNNTASCSFPENNPTILQRNRAITIIITSSLYIYITVYLYLICYAPEWSEIAIMGNTTAISITIASPNVSDDVKIKNVYRRDADKTILVVATFEPARIWLHAIGTLTDTVKVKGIYLGWKKEVYLLGLTVME